MHRHSRYAKVYNSRCLLQERPKPADARTAIKGLVDALAHLASSKVLHSDVKLLNIVRIHELSTGLKTIKLIDMDAIAKLDRSGFMGAKFSSGVLPPEMFEVLDGDGVETFSAYWDHEISQQTELWRKIEPRWSRSGDAIVVKTWCARLINYVDDIFGRMTPVCSQA